MTTKTTTTGRPKPAIQRPGGRSARVRRAVFDATLELLTADGYPALSIEAVATAAGVNKTTIYRNWPTKARLVQAAAQDRSASVIEIKPTGDLEQDLRRTLASVADYVASPIGRALVIATVSASDDPEVREAQAQFWKTRFEAARTLLMPAVSEAAADEIIEHLIAPVFLRSFVTGAHFDKAFIARVANSAHSIARVALDNH